MSSQRFPKEERLKGRKLIQTLFRKGKAFSVFPVKVYYLSTAKNPHSPSLKAGFSAPSRQFKKAVDRNLIKRRMREAYRLQNQELQNMLGGREQSLLLFFIYNGRKIPPYSLLFEKIGVSLKRLEKEISKDLPVDEKFK